MADDTVLRLEKQIEGSNLALAAVAEVLQKMDARLSRQDDVDLEKSQIEEEQADRTSLVKSIASEVFSMIKADQGMDVDGTKVRSVTKMKGRGEDVESSVNPTTKIGDQQGVIQAMQKAGDDEKDEEEEMGYKTHKAEDDEEEDGEGWKAKADAAAQEYPNKEREPKEDDEEFGNSLEKQISALKKQLEQYEGNMQKSIQGETEGRLRKMGFREERGLVAPQQIPLGVDGTMPLVKNSDPQDTVAQLANLSYKELRDLQFKIELGDTEGIPRELL